MAAQQEGRQAAGDEGVRIEPLRAEDEARARALILAGLKEHWGVLDERLNPDLQHLMRAYADGVFLVAKQGREVIGTGAFRPVSETTVEVVRMSVARPMRRQGIGRQILEALCREAACRGYQQVVLETTATWQEAIAFYRAFGFRVTHQADGNLYFMLTLPHNADPPSRGT